MKEEGEWITVAYRRRGKPRSVRRVPVSVPEVNTVEVKREVKEEDMKTKRVSMESRQELVKSRLEMKLSQVDADMKCNLAKNTINRIENGSYVPDGVTLGKIRRFMGVELRLV